MAEADKIRDALRLNGEHESITSASALMPTPVLNDHQWEIHRLLRKGLPTGTWHLFAGTCLSTFFDPLSEAFSDGQGDRDLVFATSALFVVATSPPNSAAILMVIEGNQPRLESFLTRKDVHWLLYAPQLSAREIAEQIVSYVGSCDHPRIGQSSAVNRSEFRVASALKANARFELELNNKVRALLSKGPDAERLSTNFAKSTICVLQEVAIHRFRPPERMALSSKAMGMEANSSVDILLHGRGRRNRPLLAIEVDGLVHLKKKQAYKDRAKDELLTAYGLPLIRITVSDADFWSREEVQSRESREHLNRFSRLLGAVASSVCWQMTFESDCLISESPARAAICAMEKQLSHSLFGAEFNDLSDIQRAKVHEALSDLQEWEDYLNISREFDYYRDAEIKAARTSAHWPDDLLINAGFPEVVGDLTAGMRARTVIKLQGREPIRVETPAIRMVGIELLDEDLLNQNITACLIDALALETTERRRKLTPARRS